ncbi:hypothetical protein [Acinetobacter pittii]|uniref:hypothetical protein n=1 Tax=Acinetobacter pittii TaxID=48296 RepID=UPI00102F0295|nr:hypothetical protein [Acinetobacter pittii]RZG94377.1 hypothetical protein EXE03_15965 [Acinetobacter pittii]
MIDDKINSLRSAIITSNDNLEILEVLKEALPEGYSYEREIPETKIGIEYIDVINTPNDKIHIIVSEDKKSAKTLNVINQDTLDVQPSIVNDELSKLAVELNKTESVSMQVIASHNDLIGN